MSRSGSIHLAVAFGLFLLGMALSPTSAWALKWSDYPQSIKDLIISNPGLCPRFENLKSWRKIDPKVGCIIIRSQKRTKGNGEQVTDHVFAQVTNRTQLANENIYRFHFIDHIYNQIADEISKATDPETKSKLANLLHTQTTYMFSRPRVARPEWDQIVILEPSGLSTPIYGNAFTQIIAIRSLLRAARAVRSLPLSATKRRNEANFYLDLAQRIYRPLESPASKVGTSGFRSRGGFRWEGHLLYSFFAKGSDETLDPQAPRDALNLNIKAMVELFRLRDDIARALENGLMFRDADLPFSMYEWRTRIENLTLNATLNLVEGPDRIPRAGEWMLPRLSAYLERVEDQYWSHYGMDVGRGTTINGSRWTRCHYGFFSVKVLLRLFNTIKNDRELSKDPRARRFLEVVATYTRGGKAVSQGDLNHRDYLYQMFLSSTDENFVRNVLKCPCDSQIILSYRPSELNQLNSLFGLQRQNPTYCE